MIANKNARRTPHDRARILRLAESGSHPVRRARALMAAHGAI